MSRMLRLPILGLAAASLAAVILGCTGKSGAIRIPDVLLDQDEDGVLDDGDGSGVMNDNRCAGGDRTDCDDNCPTTANADQADPDNDTVGSACDNCPDDANVDQADADNNGIGNVCDLIDRDDDGVLDDDKDGAVDKCADGQTVGCDDNCLSLANSDQNNDDNDNFGNACDNCDDAANNDQVDTDGDGQGNACDPDDDNDGAADGADSSPLNPQLCRDSDEDGCNDCSQNPTSTSSPKPWAPFTPSTTNDAADLDGDGQCDSSDADDDNDGVADAADSAPTNPQVCRDSDSDTCNDCSQNPTSTSSPKPWAAFTPSVAADGPDSDNDGRCNATDNCPNVANSDQSNTDGDLAGDACDKCPDDAANDSDNDNVCLGARFNSPAVAGNDNCPTTANTDQTNNDADTRGNACDNCPAVTNQDQLNADGDSAGDACDGCPNDPTSTTSDDVDSDGVTGCVDNCPSVANTNQLDTDGDNVGNACDNCPNLANQDQADTAPANGFGDACQRFVTFTYVANFTGVAGYPGLDGASFFTQNAASNGVLFHCSQRGTTLQSANWDCGACGGGLSSRETGDGAAYVSGVSCVGNTITNATLAVEFLKDTFMYREGDTAPTCSSVTSNYSDAFVQSLFTGGPNLDFWTPALSCTATYATTSPCTACEP